MKFYANNFFFSAFLLIFIFIFVLTFDLKFDLVGFSFLINCFLTCFLIALSLQKIISTILFYYIFNLIFLITIPWVQYSNNIIIWSKISFIESDFLIANFVIFLTSVFVFLIYFFIPNFKFSVQNIVLKRPNFLISCIVCIVCFMLVLYSLNFNILRVFFRGLSDDDTDYSLNPLLAIVVYLARFIPAFLFLRFTFNGEKHQKIIFFIFTLLCAFPTGITRFMVAYIYLPILLAYFPKFKKSKDITFVMFLSIFMIFPFLNQFRYYSSNASINFLPDLNFVNEAHFDAYQNLMEVIRFDFITFGHQLLGVFLFFVPRNFWPEKPVGSGYFLAEEYGYRFNNISMPFLGEGFVNFGYFGFLVFPFVLAVFMKLIDSAYLTRYNVSDNNFYIIKGVFYCSALFFMMRGDLLSSFSFMLAGVFAIKISEKI